MEIIAPAFLIATIVLLVAIYFIFKSPQNFTKVAIGDTTILAEMADTLPKRMAGLMFRKSLPEDGGMLFVFGNDGYHGIWMMNTSIPLDIIWIDSDHRIVDIMKDAPPCGMICTKTYSPKEMARYVLEVNAGFADEHGIGIGDKVNF